MAKLFPSMRGRQNTGLKKNVLTSCSITASQANHSGNNQTRRFTATGFHTWAFSSWLLTAKAETWSNTPLPPSKRGSIPEVLEEETQAVSQVMRTRHKDWWTSYVLIAGQKGRKMSVWCRRCTKTVNSCCVFNKPWNSSNKMVCWNDNVRFHSHVLLTLWSNY